jgi:hypothetical protein
LTPARSGSPLTLLYKGFEKREYAAAASANLKAGKCTRAIATAVTFEEKNSRERELYGICVLMKPGSNITAGNMGPSDFGRAVEPTTK